MIRSIILDLGNTIVPFDFQRAYERMTALSGLDREEIRARIRSTDLVTRFESGQVETNDFIRRLTSLLGISVGIDDFFDIWGSIFERQTLIPDSLLESLKSNGYRLVLLSNTNDLHIRFIRDRYPILRHFDRQVLSHEVGALKPSPRIYEEAIRNALCQPGECFFADDIPEYVEGARACGIDAAQFTGYDRLCADLRLRDVRF